MWTNKQKDALKAVDKWHNEWYTSRKPTKQVFYLAGYAGTGKTTLARHFAENIEGDVCFAAFTGKAALVMRQNGCEGARTIHSLIYKAEQNKKTGEVTYFLNKQSSLAEAKLLIVDECSMVDEKLAKDLLSFHRPILVLGDPAQLPPVDGAGYFTSGDPDIMLTEIHRQAKDNPIIHLASIIRNERMPKVGSYGESRIIQKIASTDAKDADQILVGRNVTRESMNTKMRKMYGFSEDKPEVGEKLICLKNDKDLFIFNGGIFSVESELVPKTKTQFLRYMLRSDDEERSPVLVKVHKSLFMPDVPTPHWKMLQGSQSFDYAYSITVHKSQGSQWKDILIQDESWCFREDRWKWLYTAVTRAQNKITLVV